MEATKHEMALAITQALFNKDNITTDNWKYRKLMRLSREELADGYETACRINAKRHAATTA